MSCPECQRHHDAHKAAIADEPPDTAYLQLNLAGWLTHQLEDHLTPARQEQP